MQATSLPFIVAATAIGLELGADRRRPTRAALIGAGLLSVLIFPAASLVLLRRSASPGRGSPRATTSRSPPRVPDRDPPVVSRQAVAGCGSGRTMTVSATAMISSTGRSASLACLRIASGLEAW